MIKTELYKIEGTKILVRTYSDENKYIEQLETGNIYEEAIDFGYYEDGKYYVENHFYIETEQEIVTEEEVNE